MIEFGKFLVNNFIHRLKKYVHVHICIILHLKLKTKKKTTSACAEFMKPKSHLPHTYSVRFICQFFFTTLFIESILFGCELCFYMCYSLHLELVGCFGYVVLQLPFPSTELYIDFFSSFLLVIIGVVVSCTAYNQKGK